MEKKSQILTRTPHKSQLCASLNGKQHRTVNLNATHSVKSTSRNVNRRKLSLHDSQVHLTSSSAPVISEERTNCPACSEKYNDQPNKDWIQ
jgi:hypothetical protein